MVRWWWWRESTHGHGQEGGDCGDGGGWVEVGEGINGEGGKINWNKFLKITEG